MIFIWVNVGVILMQWCCNPDISIQGRLCFYRFYTNFLFWGSCWIGIQGIRGFMLVSKHNFIRDDSDPFYNAVIFMLVWLNISGMGFWLMLGVAWAYIAWGCYWALTKCGVLERSDDYWIEKMKVTADSIVTVILNGLETLHGAYPGRFSTTEIRDFEGNPEITKEVDAEILAGLIEKGQDTCAICLGSYEVKETISVLPNCEHVYHDACVVEWIKRSGKCPLCRANIRGGTAERSAVIREEAPEQSAV
jgi:hypothetical protein